MKEASTLEAVKTRLSSVFELVPRQDDMDFVNHLAIRINEMILHDFPGLVQALYKIDVDEDHLKKMLKEYVHEDAGLIIARLIIEREKQKAVNRKVIENRDDDLESWEYL